jgi:hypothetical protein
MSNGDFKKGFLIGLGVMGALVVGGFALGIIQKVV